MIEAPSCSYCPDNVKRLFFPLLSIDTDICFTVIVEQQAKVLLLQITSPLIFTLFQW